MRKFTLGLVFLIFAFSLQAQQVSEKQDLTIFDISFYGPNIDRRLVEGVDARIRQVFINLGRFNVIGLTYRLDAVNVEDFLAKIRAAKEANTYIPIQFQTGQALFTEAEYNKLINSFILVIPQINDFSVEKSRNNYVVTISTSFTVIDARTMRAIKEIVIETRGTGNNESDARREAINAIVPQLQFEIRSIPQFQIRSGILETTFGQVIIERGKDIGITVGDEYVIQRKSTVAGFENVEETGLIIIKDVQEKFSRGVVIYGNPEVGDPVLELPRLGIDIVPYLTIGSRSLLDKGNLSDKEANSQVFNIGLKGIGTRGFFDVRPAVIFEYTQADLGFLGFFFIPINAWLGAEYTLYLNRITLNPGVLIGATGLYFIWDDADDPLTYSHFGVQARMNASFLLGRDFKLGGTAGARFMLGIFPGSSSSKLNDYLSSYTMVDLGLELTFKY